MRHLYTLSFAILCYTLTLQAQSVFPTYAQRPVWCMTESNFGRPLPDYSIVMLADTVICGKTYSPLFTKDYIFLTSPPVSYIDGFVRQEGKKVYQLRDSCQELLVYDFSLEVGDTMRHGYFNYTDAVVMEVQYAETNGQIRKVMTLNYSNSNRSHITYWVEGLGDLSHPLPSIPCYIDYACETAINIACISTEAGILLGICQKNCGIPTSTADISENIMPITLFPNPITVGGRVQLNYEMPESGRLLVANALGQVIYWENIEKNDYAKNRLLNWTPNAPGFYWIILENKNGERQAVKLVVQ